MANFANSPEKIEKMRAVGKQAAQVLEMIEAYVVPGVTTEKLDQLCHDYIINDLQAIPAPLNYGATYNRAGFPKSICTSVNHVVCHGIPNDKKLKAGDIVNIDITVKKDGFHGDTSKMFLVGNSPDHLKRLITITQECLYLGIQSVKSGAKLSQIAKAIAFHARKNDYSVVEDYCGHGIGEQFHESPQVLHYPEGYTPRTDVTLQAGMIFTIEPMINAGTKYTRLLKDKWTAITKDRRPSAQWEHTILVTESGCEVLTARKEEAHKPPWLTITS